MLLLKCKRKRQCTFSPDGASTYFQVVAVFRRRRRVAATVLLVTTVPTNPPRVSALWPTTQRALAVDSTFRPNSLQIFSLSISALCCHRYLPNSTPKSILILQWAFSFFRILNFYFMINKEWNGLFLLMSGIRTLRLLLVNDYTVYVL